MHALVLPPGEDALQKANRHHGKTTKFCYKITLKKRNMSGRCYGVGADSKFCDEIANRSVPGMRVPVLPRHYQRTLHILNTNSFEAAMRDENPEYLDITAHVVGGLNAAVFAALVSRDEHEKDLYLAERTQV